MAGGQLANATPCQACVLILLKSGIATRMKATLVTVQLALVLWFGGSQGISRVGNSLSIPVPTSASSDKETKQLDSSLRSMIP